MTPCGDNCTQCLFDFPRIVRVSLFQKTGFGQAVDQRDLVNLNTSRVFLPAFARAAAAADDGPGSLAGAVI